MCIACLNKTLHKFEPYVWSASILNWLMCAHTFVITVLLTQTCEMISSNYFIGSRYCCFVIVSSYPTYLFTFVISYIYLFNFILIYSIIFIFITRRLMYWFDSFPYLEWKFKHFILRFCSQYNISLRFFYICFYFINLAVCFELGSKTMFILTDLGPELSSQRP